MIYGICFVVSLVVLLWSMAANDKLKINQMLLLIVTAIGDGGYYALIMSNSLETAILANKLTYVIGIFSPMLLFLSICEICKIKIKPAVTVLLYTVQMLLYLGVCTIGTYDIFYRTVEFHMGSGGAFLTKTYGPLHGIYIFTMFFYIMASIIIAAGSFRRKNRVSTRNLDIIMLTALLIVGSYMLERVIHLNVELMPFMFTLGVITILFPITKLSRYSVEENREIIESQMEGMGYIVFSKNLRYMGCNECAEVYFPELKDWELEREIPGSGGRFNTFLRQPFMKYVKSEQQKPMNGKNFAIKDKQFHYVIRRLHYRNRHLGYVIEMVDTTDYINDSLTKETMIEDKEQRNAKERICDR